MLNCTFSRQFRLHPLVAAIILSSTCQTTFADAVTDSKPSQQDLTTSPASSSTPDERAQAFFQQYYVTRDQMNSVQIDQQRHIPETCSGTWVTPFKSLDDNEDISDPAQQTTVITADKAKYKQNGTSELSGSVKLDQPDRSMQADKVTLNKDQTIATAEGNVFVAEAGNIIMGDDATYHLDNETGQLHNAAYISEDQQAHGQAELIDRTGAGITKLQNATYSTCPPYASMPWKVQANRIYLDENTGRGISRQATLYIKDVPVLKVPYFNFPIDDRRTSGFLVPQAGYASDGGFKLEVPYYLNLAPNYDMTITPSYLSRRGPMLEDEFRFMTEYFGKGKIDAGYLPSDPLYNEQDRKRLNILHEWQISDQFKTNLNWNYLSDKDYFTDLGNSLGSTTNLNQERSLSLSYKNGIPGLDGLLRVQTFQTVDKSILDVNRPYARLPQLLLNYKGGSEFGLQYYANNDTAYFKKTIADGSALESSGTRLYNHFAARYNFVNTWGYAAPELSVRTLNDFYDKASATSQGLTDPNQKKLSVVVPQFTFDSAAVFEREGNYLQSLTPHFFYAYAPYKKQSNYPNFDTTSASLNYDQLFSASRFFGHDRLDDNNFASLGATYRMYDPVGLERLRFSLGEAYYFSNRKVLLSSSDTIATAQTSGPAMAFGSQLSKNFYIHGNSMWTNSGANNANDASISYIGDQGNLYSAGVIQRRYDPSQNQQAYKQATASIIQPLYNNWRLMGYMQYDFAHSLMREWLVGANYDACCWRVSLYGRTYYNDLDEPGTAGVKPKRAIMAEFTLKGLAGFSGDLDTLLQRKISGYQQVESTWDER